MNTYETINLNDYVQTGEGGTALTYTHKTRPTMAKLFNPGNEAELAEKEFLTARAVFEMGISTPEPLRLVTDGLSSSSPPAFNLSKRQSLFKCVIYLNQVTKLLEFHLQNQSFQ